MRLSSLDLLAEMQKPENAHLRSMFTLRSFPKDAAIFHPNDTPDRIFVVSSGRVRIYLASLEKEFTIAILEAGAVYATHTRAHVQALEPTSLLVTDTGSFHACLPESPALTGALINVLGGLLKNSYSIISGLVFRDATRRLAMFLLEEARDSGQPDENGVSVTLRTGLTMEQLAQIVGSSRQTVSMLLGDMAREGLVEKTGRGRFRIPDPALLQQLLDD